MNALKQLLKADADLASVVLSQVNVKSHARMAAEDRGTTMGGRTGTTVNDEEVALAGASQVVASRAEREPLENG